MRHCCAPRKLSAFLETPSAEEGASRLARFEPVTIDETIIADVERKAGDLGYSVRRMPSDAGHDAQMLARICTAGMIFVPSVGGIRHNVKEYTAPDDVEAGANILRHKLTELAGA